MTLRVQMPTSYVNEKLGELNEHATRVGFGDDGLSIVEAASETVARCRDLCHALELEFDNWLAQAYVLEAERRAKQ